MKHCLWLLCWVSLYAQFDVQTELLASDANSISFNAYIKNNSSTSQTGLSLKYFVEESDQTTPLVSVVDWSPIASVTPSRTLEFNTTVSALFDFSSHTFAAGEEKVIQIRLHTTDHSFMDHNNDFSFTDLTASKSSHSKVALLQNGALVFGEQPSIPTSSSSSSSSSTQTNPSILVKTQKVTEFSNSLSIKVSLHNTGDVALSNLQYNYFLNWADHTGHLVTEIDYSDVVGVVINPIESPEYLATLQFQYPSSFSLAAGDSTELQIRLHLDNNATLDFSNDYSYQGLSATLSENPFGQVLVNGASLYGSAPELPIIPNQPQKVEVKTIIVGETSTQLSLKAQVTNTSLTPLKEVVFVYYSGNHTDLTTAIDFTQVTGLQTRIVDGLLGKEIHFDFGEHIFAAGEVKEVDFRIFKTDFSAFDYTQDYSYLGNNPLGTNNNIITYVAGLQTHGTLPYATDSDNDGVADVLEVQLGTDPQDATSFPADENGVLNVALPTELSIVDASEDLIVQYDLSHIDGYSTRTAVPIRIEAGEIINGEVPTIQVYHTQDGNAIEPSKDFAVVGRILEVKAQVTEDIKFAFPIPDYVNTNVLKENLYLLHYNASTTSWEEVAIDTVQNGAVYAEVNSFSPYYVGLKMDYKPLANGDGFQIVSFLSADESSDDLYSIGKNDKGQLGIGSFDSEVRTYLYPIAKPTGMGKTVQISSGKNFTLLLDHNNKVWCWGENTHGQCGNLGDTITKPQEVVLSQTGTIKAVQVEAGDDFSLIVNFDGTVWSFGKNDVGQLGLGIDGDDVVVPTLIPSLTNVLKIAAGRAHVVAIHNDAKDQSLFAWGDNSKGQLVDATITDPFKSTPQKVDISFGTWSIPFSGVQNEYLESFISAESKGDATALIANTYEIFNYVGDEHVKILFGDNSSGIIAGAPATITKQNIVKQLNTGVANSVPTLHGFWNNIKWGKYWDLGLHYGFYFEGTFAYSQNGIFEPNGYNIYGIGSNANGRLFGSVTATTIPYVKSLDSEKNILKAGYTQSAALNDNEFYRWGEGITADPVDGFKVNKIPTAKLISLILTNAIQFTTNKRLALSGTISGPHDGVEVFIGGVKQGDAVVTGGTWSYTPTSDYVVGLNAIQVVAKHVANQSVVVVNGVINHQVNTLSITNIGVTGSRKIWYKADRVQLSFTSSIPADITLKLWKLGTSRATIKEIHLGSQTGSSTYDLGRLTGGGTQLEAGLYGYSLETKVVGLANQTFDGADLSTYTSLPEETLNIDWNKTHSYDYTLDCSSEKVVSFILGDGDFSPIPNTLCIGAEQKYALVSHNEKGVPQVNGTSSKLKVKAQSIPTSAFEVRSTISIQDLKINFKNVGVFYSEIIDLEFTTTEDIAVEINVYKDEIAVANIIQTQNKTNVISSGTIYNPVQEGNMVPIISNTGLRQQLHSSKIIVEILMYKNGLEENRVSVVRSFLVGG